MVAAGWLLRPVAATENLPNGGIPTIHDDGERFIAYYGELRKPLSTLETWRALRGIRVQFGRLNTTRRVAGVMYRVGSELYVAAADFEANEVFIDRIGARQAFSMIWRQVETDFSANWSLRAPDRIHSSDPGAQL
jgi:hypothetical protein